jgi:lambda repressor-like predicted transcriptional regulator
MGRRVEPRLPAEPVRRELERQDLVHTELAERLGVSRAVLRRQIVRGFSVNQADAIAGALGLHPNDLWGFEYWAVQARDFPGRVT